MGALPTIKRFLAEDYPTESTWIGNLLYPLNLLLNTIYSNLNNGLTFSQNMQAQVKTIAVSGSSPSTTFNYNFSSIGAPIGLFITQCTLSTGASQTIPTHSWSYNGGVISVSVNGLAAGNSYNCTFLVIGG